MDSGNRTNMTTHGLFPFGTFITRLNVGENGSQSIPVRSENILTSCYIMVVSIRRNLIKRCSLS